MDWLHCNACYSFITNPEDIARFVATNCGHVFCRTCAELMREGKCQQCGASCRIVALDANMPSEIAMFFNNTKHGLKKAASALKDTMNSLGMIQQAGAFQDKQREHLIAFKTRRPPSPPGTVRIPELDFHQMKANEAGQRQTIQQLQQELAQLKAMITSSNHEKGGMASMPGNHRMESPGPGGSAMKPPQSFVRSHMTMIPGQSTHAQGIGESTFKPPTASSRPQGSMIIGQTAPQPNGSRILQSRAAIYVPASTSNVQPKPAPGIPSRQMATPAPSRQPLQKPTGQSYKIRPQQPAAPQYASSRESVIGGARAGAVTPYPGAFRQASTMTPYPGAPRQAGAVQAVRPPSNASDSRMRSASTILTNRSTGTTIARTVMHGAAVANIGAMAGSRVSSGSSRLVAGPTYRPSESLVAKRYK